MAYRIDSGESVADGSRRIAREQLAKAIEHLEVQRGRDSDVHEARKCMKRLRALLRLVRLELGNEVYARENACFRDAARQLAGLRDATVLLETLDELVASLGSRAPRSRFAPIGIWLREQHTRTYATEAGDSLTRVGATLAPALGRVDDWPLHHSGWAGVGRGIRRNYARGRSEYDGVAWQPSVEHFHSWRKRVKYLWYHTQLLKGAWPALIGVTADELDLLGDLLGREHDLAVLAETVRRGFPRVRAASTADALERHIAARRRKVQSQAHVLGLRVYAERPRAFERRLLGYWRAWQEEHIINTLPPAAPAGNGKAVVKSDGAEQATAAGVDNA